LKAVYQWRQAAEQVLAFFSGASGQSELLAPDQPFKHTLERRQVGDDFVKLSTRQRPIPEVALQPPLRSLAQGDFSEAAVQLAALISLA
jgi:hypothetical protein